VRQQNQIATDKITQLTSTLHRIQADQPSEQCLNAGVTFLKVLGFDVEAGENVPEPGPDSCLERMKTVWQFNETTLPTQASIGSWCTGCATPIRSSLRAVIAVCSHAVLDAGSSDVMTFSCAIQACGSEEGFGDIAQFEKFFAIVLDLPCLRINGNSLLLGSYPHALAQTVLISAVAGAMQANIACPSL
jgi:hypothetical protein